MKAMLCTDSPEFRFFRLLCSLYVSGLFTLGLLALPFFSGGCRSRPALKPSTRDVISSLHHNGKERHYLLHRPPKTPSRAAPLLLVLHGGGGKLTSIIRGTKGRFNELADRHGFYVVYPEGYGRNWNDGRNDDFSRAHKNRHDDVGFLRRLIALIQKRYPIDPKRIFAAGISNGGMMAQRLACEAPEIWGIASVAAQMPRDLRPFCRPSHPVSMLLINGTQDPLVPYEGGAVTLKIIRTQIRGYVLSVEDTLAFWRKKNACPAHPRSSVIPDRDPKDGSTALRRDWGPCKNHSRVSAIQIRGGGHTWPGGWSFFGKRRVGTTNRDFRASDAIWRFFSIR